MTVAPVAPAVPAPTAAPVVVVDDGSARVADAVALGRRLAALLGAPLRVERDRARIGSAVIVLATPGDRALHAARCAVAVAPFGFAAAPPALPQVIGLAYDGSPEAEAAVPLAIDLVRRACGELVVVCAVSPMTALELAPYGPAAAVLIGIEPARQRAHDIVDDLLARLPADVPVRVELPEAATPAALGGASGHLDLLVVGSHARGRLGHFLLGSMSAAVIQEARCPVVVVPRRTEET